MDEQKTELGVNYDLLQKNLKRVLSTSRSLERQNIIIDVPRREYQPPVQQTLGKYQQKTIDENLNDLPDGLLRDLIRFILDRVPTSYEWVEMQACSLIGLAAGKERSAFSRMGPIVLQFYVLNVGPSRISFKGIPVRNFTRQILQRFGKLVNKDFEMAPRHTVEAMIGEFSKQKKEKKKKDKEPTKKIIKKISTTEDGVITEEIKEVTEKEKEKPKKPAKPPVLISDEGIMISEEFTAIFKDVKNKRYASDVLEFLSEIYDGWIAKRTTKKHGTEGGLNVFVSILASTTEYFFTNIERGFFVQGMGNRFFYIISDPQDLKRNYRTFKEEGRNFFGPLAGMDQEDTDSALDDFAQRLRNLREKLPTIFGFTESAAELCFQYYEENHQLAISLWQQDNRSLSYSYYAERRVMMLRLAAVSTISRYEKLILKAGTTKIKALIITKKDMEWAIGRIETYTQYFLKVLDIWPQAKQQGDQIKTEEDDWSNIKSVIRQFGGRAKKHEIHEKTKYGKRKLEMLLESMESAKVLKVKLAGSGPRGGRKATIYTLPKEKNDR
ncbi:MAG: hypothetical protein V3U54_12820 [Thermodesulfobacteriota bacterium]